MAPGMIHEAHALNRVRKAAVIAGELRARGWVAAGFQKVDVEARRLAAEMVGQTVADETWEWVVVVMEALEFVDEREKARG